MRPLAVGRRLYWRRMPEISTRTEVLTNPRATMPKLKALTSLRFFAALHVVVFHMRIEGLLPAGAWWYENFAAVGYIGVNLFFVLSGFILIYTYAGTGVSLRRFWQARFARIYPAYVLSLMVSAPFFFFAVRHLDIPFLAWSKQHLAVACVLTLTLLQSWFPQAALTWNAVCWSLSVEAFFYLLFPILLLWSKEFTSRKLFGAVVVWSLVSLAVSVIYIVVHPDGIDKINSTETTLLWKNVLSFNPLLRLPEFLVGVFAGRLFLSMKNRAAAGTPLVLFGVAAVSTLVLVAGRIPRPMISAGFLSPAFAAIIYGLALRPGWTRFLETRMLVLLGDASYSLYLLHSTVISRVAGHMSSAHWAQRASVAFVAAVAASLVSYYLLEEPCRKLLRPRQRRGEDRSRQW
jgi:peptidoglycan/LPS O-acetylase OafA/YrhL